MNKINFNLCKEHLETLKQQEVQLMIEDVDCDYYQKRLKILKQRIENLLNIQNFLNNIVLKKELVVIDEKNYYEVLTTSSLQSRIDEPNSIQEDYPDLEKTQNGLPFYQNFISSQNINIKFVQTQQMILYLLFVNLQFKLPFSISRDKYYQQIIELINLQQENYNKLDQLSIYHEEYNKYKNKINYLFVIQKGFINMIYSKGIYNSSISLDSILFSMLKYYQNQDFTQNFTEIEKKVVDPNFCKLKYQFEYNEINENSYITELNTKEIILFFEKDIKKILNVINMISNQCNKSLNKLNIKDSTLQTKNYNSIILNCKKQEYFLQEILNNIFKLTVLNIINLLSLTKILHLSNIQRDNNNSNIIITEKQIHTKKDEDIFNQFEINSNQVFLLQKEYMEIIFKNIIQTTNEKCFTEEQLFNNLEDRYQNINKEYNQIHQDYYNNQKTNQ